MTPKPRLAVFKFASCDGCQLQLLEAGDRLLELAGRVEIDHFLEASSRVVPGPYDVGLVEGSITTAADAARIREIRGQCRMLVTIGACATAGGIQALRNWGRIDDFLAAVRSRRPALVPASAGAAALDIAMRILDGLVCVRLGAGSPTVSVPSNAAA